MNIKKSDYKPAIQHTVLTTGEVIKMLRKLKGWTQEELAKYCSINAKNISILENDKLEIGKKESYSSLRHLMYTPLLLCFPNTNQKKFKKQHNKSLNADGVKA